MTLRGGCRGTNGTHRLRLAASRDARNLSIFGSVARGDAHDRSDLVFLVDWRSDGPCRRPPPCRNPEERRRAILEAMAAMDRRRPPNRGRFENDELVQGWRWWRLQIISEVVRVLPAEVRAGARDIP